MAMEEDEDYPKTLQEELNEILEAFYALVSEDDIKTYQSYLEQIRKQRIAEGAVQAVASAPDFELPDQEGDMVRLNDLLEKGPVVLLFYRGKWCPHCNATLMRFQRCLSKIQEKGATLVAISPMLPDGTQALATKKSLEFLVLSDFGNEVARKYRLTFTVPEEVRPSFEAWQENVPEHNADSSWEIPLPATYIINQEGEIIWSFVDNDPGCRGEPEDIVAAIPTNDTDEKKSDVAEDSASNKSSKTRINDSIKKGMKKLFGKKKQSPQEFIGHYKV